VMASGSVISWLLFVMIFFFKRNIICFKKQILGKFLPSIIENQINFHSKYTGLGKILS